MEANSNRAQVDVMTQRNTALVYNILPAHVAKDFIGSKRSEEVSDYSLHTHNYLLSLKSDIFSYVCVVLVYK